MPIRCRVRPVGCCRVVGQVHAGRRLWPLSVLHRWRGSGRVRRRGRRAAGRNRLRHRPAHGRTRRRAGRPRPSLQEKLYNPTTDSYFHCLPAEPKRLEGLDYTLAILDEAGVANRDSYEVLTLAQGSVSGRRWSASARRDRTRTTRCSPIFATTPPSIPTTGAWCGASSRPPASRITRPTANTAGSWRTRRSTTSCTVTPSWRCCRRRLAEATFRRARLCQFATDTDGRFLPAGCWEGLSTGQPVPMAATW